MVHDEFVGSNNSDSAGRGKDSIGQHSDSVFDDIAFDNIP